MQVSVAELPGLVAYVDLNARLFRLGPLPGFSGLNITRHAVSPIFSPRLGVDLVGSPALPSQPTQVPTP